MAEERITLNIGGQYSAKDAFSQVNSDVKGVQKSAKDMTTSFSSGLSNVAGMLNGQAADAVKGFSSLVRGLGSGGVFGLVTAAATAALGFIITKFNEAREAAAKFADICRTEIVDGMKSIASGFKDVSTDIANAKSDAKDMLAVLNGAIASEARTKVQELHIQTLQQITDGMSEAGKNAILANEAYQAAIIKNTAAIEQAEAATKQATDNVSLMAKKRQAAEQALLDVQAQRQELETQMTNYGRGWLATRQKLQEQIAQNEQNYADGLYDQYKYIMYDKELKLKLAEIEDEHKNELAQYNEALKLVDEATKNVDMAKREEEAATRAVTLAQQNETNVRNQCIEAFADATAKQKEANALLEKENAQKREKIEQQELEKYSAQERLDILEASNKAERTALALNIDKNYLLETFKDLTGEGLTKQEAYNKITERINEIMQGRQKIEEVCARYGLETTEFLELYNESMYNGSTITEAYAKLQEKLNESIGARTDAEDALTSQLKTKKPTDTAHASVSVKIDPSDVSDGVERGTKRGQTAWDNMQNDLKDANSKMNNMQRDWNRESAHLNTLLTGQMPKEQADQYVQYLQKKYPTDFVEKQVGKTLKNKLFTTTEKQTYLKNFNWMINMFKQGGLGAK